MRIIFFTHYFPPEVNAPANRTYEHCREWAALGHDVHVVTCIPSHPFGTPFPGFERRWYQYEKQDGIHVHRVWTYLAANRGVLKRTLNFVSFIPTACIRAFRLGKFDVAIGTSPQFFCAVATWIFCRLRRIRWVFELRDLWPESIPAVGAMQRSFALSVIEWIELRMYRDASAIVSTSESFNDRLHERGIDANKLCFVPNGILPEFWRTDQRAAERQAMGLDDNQVLVSYVGTIGMAHGLSMALTSARQLQSVAPHVQLLIVGDGAELESLRAAAARESLTNVRFTGLIPRERVPALLAATDIALITLKPADTFKKVLPSKMFEAMAARCAIVLGVDGEARRVLERAGAGIVVPPGNAEALTQAIAGLSEDRQRRMQMGLAGGEFVDREFHRRSWAARYLTILERVGLAHRVSDATIGAVSK